MKIYKKMPSPASSPHKKTGKEMINMEPTVEESLTLI
jgi:hypothetical protein